jgi:hypothetical protein
LLLVNPANAVFKCKVVCGVTNAFAMGNRKEKIIISVAVLNMMMNTYNWTVIYLWGEEKAEIGKCNDEKVDEHFLCSSYCSSYSSTEYQVL